MDIFSILIVVIVNLLFAVSLVGIIVGFVGLTVNMFKAVNNRKSNVSIRDYWFNPFNVLIKDQFLNESGIEAKKRVVYWLKIFLIASFCGLLATLIVNVYP
jgi:hypothetical protein